MFDSANFILHVLLVVTFGWEAIKQYSKFKRNHSREEKTEFIFYSLGTTGFMFRLIEDFHINSNLDHLSKLLSGLLIFLGVGLKIRKDLLLKDKNQFIFLILLITAMSLFLLATLNLNSTLDAILGPVSLLILLYAVIFKRKKKINITF